MKHFITPATPVETRKLIQAWPHVLRRATDPKAQAFAFRIWELSGSPKWLPTLKQVQVMRRMVRDLSAQQSDDLRLLED